MRQKLEAFQRGENVKKRSTDIVLVNVRSWHGSHPELIHPDVYRLARIAKAGSLGKGM